MSDSPIRFGTDGWRALIADDFTFANVRACAQAAAEHFAETRGRDAPLMVGWDTRFLSEQFAEQAARVLANAGFDVLLADRPAPTPATSQQLVERGAAGGLVITSSHNPFNWNGVKVKPHYGGSASPEVVADIEGRLPAIARRGEVVMAAASDPRIRRYDPLAGYLAALAKKVDIERIRGAGLRIAFDPMFGTGAGLLGRLLEGGKTTVTEIHGEWNPRFPGLRAPEPIEENLGELEELIGGGGFDAGIALDGDSDRLGLVDEQGRYIDQLRTFAILVYALLELRGQRGAIIRSITTTEMADRLAKAYGVECIETPVGFKYIGPLMIERDALIGGEESGGYGFRGHLPERDGLLAALYVLDAVAQTGKRPSELLADVFAVTGAHFYRRADTPIDPAQREAIVQRLNEASPASLAGMDVTGSDRLDGWRFRVKGGWLLFRLSGTEPLLRIYTEVEDEELVAPMIEAGRELAGIRA